MALRGVTLPGIRAAGVATAAQFSAGTGLAISGWSVSASNAGGFYTAPIKLPSDYDVTRPGYLYNFLRNSIASAAAGLAFHLEQRISFGQPTAAMARLDIDIDVAVPNPWAAGDTMDLLFDSDVAPVGYSIPAHSLDPEDWIGVRVFRDPANANDTYPNAINFASAVLLEYHPRCQRPCC